MGCLSSKMDVHDDDMMHNAGPSSPPPRRDQPASTPSGGIGSNSKKQPTSQEAKAAAAAAAARKRADTIDNPTLGRPQQWEYLLRSYTIVHPADVPATIDSWMDRAIKDNLSGPYVTFLVRKVRKVRKQMALSSPTTTTKSGSMAKMSSAVPQVFGTKRGSDASSSNGKHHHHHHTPTLIPAAVLKRVLPESVIQEGIMAVMVALADRGTIQPVADELAKLSSSSNSTSTTATKNSAATKNASQNATTTTNNNNEPSPLTTVQKIQSACQGAVRPADDATASSLSMIAADRDVHKSSTTLHAVTTVLGLAYGHRSQQLNLLFYACAGSDFMLKQLVDIYPAFLLEPQQSETTIKMALTLQSLVHYHYHGMPPSQHQQTSQQRGGGNSNNNHNVFVPSPNKHPIRANVGKLVASLTTAAATLSASTAMASTTAATGGGGGKAVNGGSVLGLVDFMNESSTMSTTTTTGENGKDNGPSASPQQPDGASDVMKAIASTGGAILDAVLPPLGGSTSSTNNNNSNGPTSAAASSSEPSTTTAQTSSSMGMMTINEFFAYAEEHWDDLMLDKIMHRCFGQGIFPHPELECKLVYDTILPSTGEPAATAASSSMTIESMTTSFLRVFTGPPAAGGYNVFGGLGNYDGMGGLGAGVLYVIPKPWWDQWNKYTTRKSRRRPPPLNTDSLLAGSSNGGGSSAGNAGPVVVRGVCGSYEFLKTQLVQGRDYVLVTPIVWDRLYELYAGGPPLPRMVIPGTESSNVIPVPSKVVLHPWIIQVILCDPVQPYRRGENGSMSIRVMVTHSQPLWRVLGEIMCRFPTAQNSARLWKRITADHQQGNSNGTPTTSTNNNNNNNSVMMSRYGPYRLLCKNAEALVPTEDNMKEAVASWKEYTANETVEGTGLVDGDILLLEYSIFNKNGDLTWPRKAAAEDGRQRRLAEEDQNFLLLLQGLDSKGEPMLKPPPLVGMEVDAQDRSDRWYTVKIEEVKIFDTDDSDYEGEEPGEDEEVTDEPVSRKKVKVSFPGGHSEWIDVTSKDRLTLPGRMSSEREEQNGDKKDPPLNTTTTTNGSGSSTNNGRSRSTANSNGRNNSNADIGSEYQKASPLPGFGATGLTNLGNSCYMNSAIQCMAYLPLLRAYLLSAQYKSMGDLNKDNPLGTGGKLLEEFAELLRVMWSAKVAEKSPNKFKLQLSKNNSQFSGSDQQDAQEFLNYIIDILHEDSNRVEKKPYVENLDDDWVAMTDLRVVGDETWKRFLRRNRSIMSDVAMGQTLNTVSCPHCHYESRSFDPFNLLSIPVPAVAEAVFQCKLIRRATPRNCPWVVNRPRKHEKGPLRYNFRPLDSADGAPSEAFIAETYVISLSRLADGGDLKLQLQNLSGIPVRNLRLCRSEEFVVNPSSNDESCLRTFTKIIPLTDKDPAANQQHAKKRGDGDVVQKGPIHIIAFETTMSPRRLPDIEESDKVAKTEADDQYPSSREKALIDQHLKAYSDDKEARVSDTDPIAIAKAVSRSLWPRNEAELKIGLRVDALDHKGNFVPGRVCAINESFIEGQDTDTGEVEKIVHRKVVVHFDNFLARWDEAYTFDAFQKRKIVPLYSQTESKNRVSEHMVSHRYFDRKTRKTAYFGLSFLVQLKNEWSTARAGAHILLQTSRFLYRTSSHQETQHVTDKVHGYVSELIDTLLEKDKEFIHQCLGLSGPGANENGSRPYRNPSYQGEEFSAVCQKKIEELMKKLPFDLIVCTEPETIKKPSVEKMYSFAVNDTVGNFINSNNTLILQWREPSSTNKPDFRRADPILYSHPQIHAHAASADLLKTFQASKASTAGEDEPSQDGLDLAYCLTNYCKEQKLLLSDNWTCPKCKKVREAPQKLTLWRMPDLLTFHIKRFNMSARWHEKILTKVNFPMTGLDMSAWCHDGSPARDDQNVYDLIGVMNHYGSMTGGHYIATCKATLSGKDGREEVAYGFNGRGINFADEDLVVVDEPSQPPHNWGGVLGRGKAKPNNRADAAQSAKAAASSAEPTWLQFDDEIVEQIPPRHIVSEMAYVLFYRKRALNPSNIAKYSTIE